MQPVMNAISVPATAGNVEYSVTNNNPYPLQMLFGELTLVTDATVANRQPKLGLYDPSGNLFMETVIGTNITASLTTKLKYLQGIYRETAIVNGAIQVPIPNEAVIPAKWSIRITVVNGAAGDSYTAKFMTKKYEG